MRILVAATVAIACAACTVKPTPTDTGYVGTWTRGTEYARSIVSIVKDGDRYLFRPGVTSRDGNWTMRCDWDGACEESVDREKVSTYTFRTWVDPETKHLMVECTGKVTKPKPFDIHYIDELVVAPDGKSITAYTHERSGQTFEGGARPQYTYTKVANGVSNPPRAASR